MKGLMEVGRDDRTVRVVVGATLQEQEKFSSNFILLDP
jgi:hypothetical protein